MGRGGRGGQDAARRRAIELGYPGLRLAVKALLEQGKTVKEIADLMNVHRSAVRWHRDALKASGDDVAAPDTYRIVLDGMCEALSPREISNKTGIRRFVVERYVAMIRASGVFDGLECETCRLSELCKANLRRRRQAMCEQEIAFTPDRRRRAIAQEPDGWADRTHFLRVDDAKQRQAYWDVMWRANE